MRGLALALALAASSALAAPAAVEICYDWSCARSASVTFADADLARIGARLAGAADAAGERLAIADAVGELYRLAGDATPIGHDRAGNWADQDVEGRMDCIDHSTTTTRLLRLMAARGWLRFHRVLEPARRTRFLIGQHLSAVVEEIAPASQPVAVAAAAQLVADDAQPAPVRVHVPSTAAVPARYVVDSWFVDNGKPAVVLPLEDWMKGDGPNVH
jgi:hypothetical protein